MHSSFRDLECYLRTLSCPNENNIQLILKIYSSKITTYEIPPGTYTFKDLSEVLSRGFKKEFELRKLRPNHINDNSDSFIIESDNVTLLSKLFSRYEINLLKFDKKSLFITVLVCLPFWDYKNPVETRNFVYYSEKNRKKSINDEIHLKCDVIDGSVLNGVRQPIFHSFVLDKPSPHKVFCEPGTIHYEKLNKHHLNTKTLYLEDDHNEEVNFNGETLTFILRMIKI